MCRSPSQSQKIKDAGRINNRMNLSKVASIMNFCFVIRALFVCHTHGRPMAVDCGCIKQSHTTNINCFCKLWKCDLHRELIHPGFNRYRLYHMTFSQHLHIHHIMSICESLNESQTENGRPRAEVFLEVHTALLLTFDVHTVCIMYYCVACCVHAYLQTLDFVHTVRMYVCMYVCRLSAPPFNVGYVNVETCMTSSKIRLLSSLSKWCK